jgi:hypothetical protein
VLCEVELGTGLARGFGSLAGAIELGQGGACWRLGSWPGEELERGAGRSGAGGGARQGRGRAAGELGGRAVAGQCGAEVDDGRRADRCGDCAQMDRGKERGDLRKRMGRL